MCRRYDNDVTARRRPTTCFAVYITCGSRSLALIAAFGAGGCRGALLGPTEGQEGREKDEKKDEKDEKKDEKLSKIRVPGQGRWRYRVVRPEGKSIAIGVRSFAKKEDCLAVVDLLKATLVKGK